MTDAEFVFYVVVILALVALIGALLDDYGRGGPA